MHRALGAFLALALAALVAGCSTSTARTGATAEAIGWPYPAAPSAFPEHVMTGRTLATPAPDVITSGSGPSTSPSIITPVSQ